MSVSTVYVLKFLNERARRVFQVVETIKSAASVLQEDDGDVEPVLDEADRKTVASNVEELLSYWDKPEAVYAACYMDNDSVGGSNIWLAKKALESLPFFQCEVINAGDFLIWRLVQTERCDHKQLVKFAAKVYRKYDAAERVLLLNVMEAALSWTTLSVGSVIVVMNVFIGPTWRDEMVLDASNA